MISLSDRPSWKHLQSEKQENHLVSTIIIIRQSICLNFKKTGFHEKLRCHFKYIVLLIVDTSVKCPFYWRGGGEHSAHIFKEQATLWKERSLWGSAFRVEWRQVDVDAVTVAFCRQKCTCSDMRNMQRTYRESLMLRHRICLEFCAAWAKRQSGNKRLEAARALCSPHLQKVQTYPLGYKLVNKMSTPEVTVSAEHGIRKGKEQLFRLDNFIVAIFSIIWFWNRNYFCWDQLKWKVCMLV